MKDLEINIRTGNLQIAAPAFYRMESIRKGLATAMIGNGNGPVSPGCCLLDDRLGVGKGIHVTHGGMQMQFHALFPGGHIFSLGHLTGHDGKGLEYGFVGVVIHQQFALDLQHSAIFHTLQNRLRFLVFQETADTDGGGVVRHVKIDNPGIALFQLLMFYRKHTAFHNDNTHIQAHILHGHGLSLEGFAIDGAVVHRSSFFLGRFSGFGERCDHIGAHCLHSIKERLALQILTCFNFHIHLHAKLIQQTAAHSRHTLQQKIFTVGRQVDVQHFPFPAPACAGKAAPGHGVFRHKQLHHIFRLHALQLRGRIHRLNEQTPQAIDSTNIPSSFGKQLLGNVGFRTHHHTDCPFFRIDICRSDGRLRKQPT